MVYKFLKDNMPKFLILNEKNLEKKRASRAALIKSSLFKKQERKKKRELLKGFVLVLKD